MRPDGIEIPKPVGNRSRQYKRRAYNQESGFAIKQTNAGMPAKRVYRSGAVKGIGQDGDIAAEWYLAEAKNYTPCEDSTGAHLKLYLKWLDKIMEEGKISGKPGIVVYQAKGRSTAYVVVDRDQFIELMGRAYQALKGNQ